MTARTVVSIGDYPPPWDEQMAADLGAEDAAQGLAADHARHREEDFEEPREDRDDTYDHPFRWDDHTIAAYERGYRG